MRKANTPPFAVTCGLPFFGLLLCLFSYTFPARAQCIGTGVMNGNSFARSGTGAAFSALPNIGSTDNNYATAEVAINMAGSQPGEKNTEYLTASGFNFNIPVNAAICG